MLSHSGIMVLQSPRQVNRVGHIIENDLIALHNKLFHCNTQQELLFYL